MNIHSGIKDDGSNFQIVPNTRKIIVPKTHKVIGTVGSHNSEQITIQCPKVIDGHNVARCSKHFICWSNDNGEYGRYDIPSDNIREDYTENFYMTWIIDGDVTVSEGLITFSIHFEDYDSNDKLIYSWGTAECSECEVLATVKNTGGSVRVPEGYIKPAGTLNITQNGLYDVTNYAFVTVDIANADSGDGGDEIVVLGTPSISINGSILTITNGVGSFPDFYEIAFSTGEVIATTSDTTYDISQCSIFEILGGGTFNIVVRGIDKYDNRSDYSNTVIYVHGGTDANTEVDYGTKTIKVGETIGIGGRRGDETPSGYSWSLGDNPNIINVKEGGFEDEYYDCVAVTGVSVGTTKLKIHYTNYDMDLGACSYTDVYTIQVTDSGESTTTTTYETYNLKIGESVKLYPNITGKDSTNIAYETITNEGVISIDGTTSEYLTVKALKAGTASIKTSTSNYDDNWNEIFGICYVTINVANGSEDTTSTIEHTASKTASVEVGKTINLSPEFDSSWDNTGAIKATATKIDDNGVVSIGDLRFGLYFECTGVKAGTATVKIYGNVTQNDGTKHSCEVTYTITVTESENGGNMSFQVDFYDSSDTSGSIRKSETFVFEDGMTWEEWVGSSYNTIGAYFDEYDQENHLWFGDAGHYISTSKETVIEAGARYDAYTL